jgi:hypothetical protein
MTLADAVIRLRYLLHEPVEKMWTTVELGIWLNDGQRVMCTRRGIEEVWTDTLAAEDSAVVTTDFQSIYKVTFANTGEDAKTLLRSEYSIFHNTITFTEEKTGDLEVWGTRQPVQAISATEFEIPEQYMDGPIYYAMEAANLKDENYAEAQIYQQLFALKQAEWERSHKFARSQMTDQWM